MPGPAGLRALALGGGLRALIDAQPAVAQPVAMTPAIRAGLLTAAIRKPVARPAGKHALLDHLVIRPELLDLHAILTPDAGVPREGLDCPVSPDGPITDTTVFEAPADPAARSYLPRYRVLRVGGQEQVRFRRTEAGADLEVVVAAEPPPGVDPGAMGPVAHELQLVLRYGADVVVDKAMAMEATPEGHRLGRLALAQSELARVVTALQDPSMRAKLVCRRVVTAGVPVAPGEVPPAPPIAVAEALPADPGLRLGVAGLSRMRLLGMVRAEGIAAAVEPPPPPPPPAVALFRRQTVALDHDERDAFLFPPGLTGNEAVYAEVLGTPQAAGLQPVDVPFEGRLHRYWREGDTFHFLPDSFKLGRRPEPPHAPMLLLRFAAGDGGIEDVTAQLDYVLVPHVDPDRLADAAAQLPAQLGEADLRPAFGIVSVAREKVAVRLALPGAQGGVRTEAQVELATAVRERVDLPLADFQDVWASLFSATPVLFQGTVEVTVGDRTEPVPVIARMDDLVGTVLAADERFDGAGGVVVTFTNRCESPVTAEGLQAGVVLADGSRVALRPKDPATRLDLAPGATAEVAFEGEAPSEQPTDVLVDFTRLAVALDQEALYEAILDGAARAEFGRVVRVRAKHLFQPPADDPLVAVLFDFERGESVELTPEAPDGQGVVRLPLADVVLGRVGVGGLATAAFRYRVRLVRTRSQVEGPWVDATAEPVYAAAPVPEPA